MSCDNFKLTACKLAGQVFVGIWDDIHVNLKSKLQDVLPANVEKLVAYDLKKNLGKYLNATLRMCQAMERGMSRKKTSFLPTRTSNIPCHTKFDTEAISQMLVPYKERTEARKLAVTREKYNDWVWQKAMDLSHKMFHKMKGFSFHYKISTLTEWLFLFSCPEKQQVENSQGPCPVLLKNLKAPDPDQLEWIQEERM